MQTTKPLSEVYNSFGVAIGFTFAGLVFAMAPTYLAASEAWSVVWYIVAAVLGLFGLVGSLVELGELRGSEAASRFGVATLILGLSALFFILTRTGTLINSTGTICKIITIILAAFGVLVMGMGIGSWLHERNTKPQVLQTPKDKSQAKNKLIERAISLLVALVGLATAVIGFLAALQKI